MIPDPKAVQLANESFREWGHAVVWYRKWPGKRPEGEVTNTLWGEVFTGKRFRVMREATAAETNSQLELFRRIVGTEPPQDLGNYLPMILVRTDI